MGVLVVVSVLGVHLEPNMLGHSPGLVIVRVRVRAVMKIILRLEVVVVVGVIVLVVQIPPEELSNISVLSAVEVYHAPQSVCVKDDAPLNISAILVTLDTSHLERSPLNNDAE